ncbi:phenylalanine--tRNA ligase subunit beta [Vicingus serpentipes]|uniref:Phenylalanine--tRNA ligase beta subunit n=1 Tax=Vicingus serpentipes TaxID=1926625 RepID=A0A5C6RT97_9FLAO|nr:phenylalanine--tRNA ligase subunit beta [Vicingus serpentipes]TXB65174.1 phenylalanine--tRNA ligase subunit beta [Vicingus serpentipes]
MKISYNWLKNYIDVTVNPEKISQILTDSGLEVEGFEKQQTIKGGLEGLVIGEVITKTQHPNADKLSLTAVDVGEENYLSIVCGAPNVAAGQKVVVATIGTTLYSGEDSFKIKKSKIRGELSEGMICAEDEIGLGKSHDGIMVLDVNAKIGTPAKEYFKIEDDYIYEIGLTPNRADATGHIGVARDIVAVLNTNDASTSKLLKPSVDNFKIDNANNVIEVEVQNEDLCPRYTGVTLSGIEVKDSPDWLKNRLLSIGLTPINNIVDVTNFVLHETGQPLHAFDADKIEGKKVRVGTLPDKTKFTTLDDKDRELSVDDLMICNDKEGMCIAGVFGGAKSGVSKSTTSIFLESAYFNPVAIRKTAKRQGLNTDASFRYERGCDPNITVYALKRAISLMKEVAGGQVSSDIIDVYPTPIKNFEVEFSFANCEKIIGEFISPVVIKNILSSLEIEILNEDENGLKLSVPPFKVDVQREIDVIEEVLRVYGYNTIKLPSTMNSAVVYRAKIDKEEITNSISDMLIANGFHEIMSNSLTKSSYYKEQDTLVEVSNPLSSELDVLRQSMLYNGLEVVQYNQNRKTPNLKLFEFGKTYYKKEEKFKETNFLSLIVSGNHHDENWINNGGQANFYHLKGFVDSLITKFGLNNLKFVSKDSELNNLAYGLCYEVNNKELLNFGKIDVSVQKQFDINQEVFYAQINYDVLIELLSYTKNLQYKEVSKYPSVRRDLALLLDSAINYSQIEAIALKQEKKLLKNINLFDVYEGKNLELGKKSYAVSFVFQDENKTLTDNQIDATMNKLVSSFEKELGAKLR